MKKLIVSTLAVLILSGCTNRAGQTEYDIAPFEKSDGTTICCKIHVFNSKDYDRLKFIYNKGSDGSLVIELDETGVSSSNPAEIQADGNSKIAEAITSVVDKL
jgi:uncharacterized lipoprotein NlpE involved in copper resistance